MIHINAAVDLLDAFVRYAYNVEFDEFKKLYDSTDEAYLLGKYKFMQETISGFFGELDTAHRKKLVYLIEQRYFEKEGVMLHIEEHSDE